MQNKCATLGLGVWSPTGTGDAVRWDWHNKYATTIQAINSIVIKLARLTRIVPLYRGWTGATLPRSFFEADAQGLCGGVEYGFSSTTTERSQALHYATGKAAMVLELEMGMVDRGADISWLSQCAPHIFASAYPRAEVDTCLRPLLAQTLMRRRPCYRH